MILDTAHGCRCVLLYAVPGAGRTDAPYLIAKKSYRYPPNRLPYQIRVQ
jgi:hypothetical protein